MPCGITSPLGCIGQLVGSTASSAWDAVCLSFAAAADALLKAFARAFTAIPPVDLTSPGVKNVYAISLGIAAAITVLLLLGQVIHTAFTHDGTALAYGLAGLGKAAAAFVLTLAIASAAVTAADSLTSYIISRSFGSAARLTARITTLLSFTTGTGPPGQRLAGGASLLLLLAIVAMLLIVVLWFELLLRNAAIAVLVATSPIAAAGMTSAPSRSWWPRMAAATGQLIILKPVIALVFAVGLELTGTSHDVETLLAGMLILLLAVVAWPVIARFFTFASVGLSGSTGLGVVLGFAAGRLSGGAIPAAGGTPGVSGHLAEVGETAHAAGEAAGAATTGVLRLAAAGVQAAYRATAALAGRMDQVAGHAGLAPPGYQSGGGWAGAASARSARQLPGRPRGWAAPGGRGPSAEATDDTDGRWSADWPVPGQADGSPAGQDWPEPEADPWATADWPRDRPAPVPETPPAGPEAADPRPREEEPVREQPPAPADDGPTVAPSAWPERPAPRRKPPDRPGGSPPARERPADLRPDQPGDEESEA
jgi:hypothetical protein